MDLHALPAAFDAVLRAHRGRPFAKWLHYFEIYDRHLARFRGRALNFLEIGVDRGGSLQLWRSYLGPAATIHGVDNNPAAREMAAEGFRIHIGDQADAGFLAGLKAAVPQLDVVIDDGGHRMHELAASFQALYPHLAPDSVYICEDLHTCYMQSYGGGYRKDDSFLERSKDWIDRLHASYSEDATLRPDAFTQSTSSLHYYDSVLVVEKRPRRAPMMLVAEDGRLDAHAAVPR
jgi:hypothetical protein